MTISALYKAATRLASDLALRRETLKALPTGIPLPFLSQDTKSTLYVSPDQCLVILTSNILISL
jgi:hypothetical protein